MKDDNSQNLFSGLSAMNIVTLIVIAGGAFAGYIKLESTVTHNTELLEGIKYALEKEHDWAEEKHTLLWERIREHRH